MDALIAMAMPDLREIDGQRIFLYTSMIYKCFSAEICP
jgi:hypothetical protein